MSSEWNRRFFQSTRGLIVLQLRRRECTVNELAAHLQLTDNAVRAHLSALERDELVERAGMRRGSGKPAYAYKLTDAARFLFPRAYGAILTQMLEVATEELGVNGVLDLLQVTGRRLAQTRTPASGSMEERVSQAGDLIAELGGAVDVTESDTGYQLKGFDCPFSDVVVSHPQFCQAVEAMLEEFVGATVNERCNRNNAPRCCFEIVAGKANTVDNQS